VIGVGKPFPSGWHVASFDEQMFVTRTLRCADRTQVRADNRTGSTSSVVHAGARNRSPHGAALCCTLVETRSRLSSSVVLRQSAVASFTIDDVTVDLSDTLGHPDAEVERTLGVLDGAVLVISAAEGVHPQTRILTYLGNRPNGFDT
jgi:hypothetical protein